MSAQHKILFICQHNSGRSQIAEAYLKKFAGEGLVVVSAGLVPAERINPLVVEVMKEDGIDLSGGNRRAFSNFSKQEISMIT